MRPSALPPKLVEHKEGRTPCVRILFNRILHTQIAVCQNILPHQIASVKAVNDSSNIRHKLRVFYIFVPI